MPSHKSHDDAESDADDRLIGTTYVRNGPDEVTQVQTKGKFAFFTRSFCIECCDRERPILECAEY